MDVLKNKNLNIFGYGFLSSYIVGKFDVCVYIYL